MSAIVAENVSEISAVQLMRFIFLKLTIAKTMNDKLDWLAT